MRDVRHNLVLNNNLLLVVYESPKAKKNLVSFQASFDKTNNRQRANGIRNFIVVVE